MKIKCPHCGKLARVVRIQDTGKGRRLIRLDGYLWCPAEESMVRESTGRPIRA